MEEGGGGGREGRRRRGGAISVGSKWKILSFDRQSKKIRYLPQVACINWLLKGKVREGLVSKEPFKRGGRGRGNRERATTGLGRFRQYQERSKGAKQKKGRFKEDGEGKKEKEDCLGKKPEVRRQKEGQLRKKRGGE